MDNYLIIGIIIVIAFVAVRTMVKRIGRKGCCGSSGDYKSRKKKLKHVIATRVFVVEGMHCENCEIRVENALNRLDGVACKVSWKKKTAVVSYSQEVSEDLLKETVECLGYQVTQIR